MAKSHDYGMSKGSKNKSSYSGYSKPYPSNTGNSRSNNNFGNSNGSKPSSNKVNVGYNNKSNGSSRLGEARAPYNFVPLNDKVIKAPLATEIDPQNISESYAKYITTGKRYTGYFEVEVKNITPLYIGGDYGFFKNGTDFCIPGSTMRGCIKNIFKIITSSAFRVGKDPDITDKHLYFRSFTSPFKSFKKIYDDRMINQISVVNGAGKTQMVGRSVAKAGFIVKEENKYYICPAEFRSMKGFGDNKVVWKNDCCEVYTGRMMSKKHYYRLFAPRWKSPIPISEDKIRDYVDDNTRKGRNVLAGYNKKDSMMKDGHFEQDRALLIFRNTEKYSYIYPCFYTLDERGDVAHFGANPYYRIPYLSSIGDHVPEEIKNETVIDFTDAVFGRKEDWSSRVAFEDLYLAEKPVLLNAEYNKILGTPNPTSFQFYLEKNNKTSVANHWDNECHLRGYKLYWHTNMDWRADYGQKLNVNMATKIAPLKHNHIFKGRIRFEYLDEKELGALCALFALTNEKDICLKIGMGKSIGMGSVKVTAKLMLQNDEYFSTLFDDSGFAKCEEESNLNDFKDSFDSYMNEKMAEMSYKLYKERIAELRLILSTTYMNKPEWNNIVSKMDFLGKGDDKKIANQRIPLPNISEVVSKLK